MKFCKPSLIIFTALISGLLSCAAPTTTRPSPDAPTDNGRQLARLYQQVKQLRLEEENFHKEREQQFLLKKQQMETKLAEVLQIKQSLENTSAEMEALYAAQRETIAQRRKTIRAFTTDEQAYAYYAEFLGTINTNTEQSATTLDTSFQERQGYLQEISTTVLKNQDPIDLAAIEKLFLIAIEEMFASQNVKSFTAPLKQRDGSVETTRLVRIGNVNVISPSGRYVYRDADGVLAEYNFRPSSELARFYDAVQNTPAEKRPRSIWEWSRTFQLIELDPTGFHGSPLLKELSDKRRGRGA